MVAQADHYILLLPYADIQSPPEWLTKHFNISPGGKHADQKTENRLVLFADGSYLELIAFVNNESKRRDGHWWDLPYGLVDYALTTPTPFNPSSLNSTLSTVPTPTQSPFSYRTPLRGGRTTPAGVEMQWDVTFPVTPPRRGTLPFWCHDVTPRHRRVNVSDPKSVVHPSGVTGVSAVEVAVKKDWVDAVAHALGVVARADGDGEQGEIVRSAGEWAADVKVGAVVAVHGAKKPRIKVRELKQGEDGWAQGFALRLVFQTKQDVEDVRKEINGGLVSIGFDKVA